MEEEIIIVENKKPVIEGIFSMHLIYRYKSLSLGCFYKILE